MRYGSNLQGLVFCTIILCNVVILTGFDTSSGIVLPGNSSALQLDNEAKADKSVVVQPVNLRCEYLVNPLGIDVVRPRLSWVVESPENGQLQSAYRIQVASSVDALKAGKPDICGQGVYEAFINGTEVSDEVLGPALSYYSKRMLYDTYDVTHLIHKGDNAIGVWLAPGWFGDPATWTEMQIPVALHGFPYPPHALIAQLEIRYADSSVETIGTDGGWKAEAGPLIPVRSHWKYCFGFSGEVYDATREMAGWNTADFDYSGWKNINFVSSPTAQLRARMIEPNRVTSITVPVKKGAF